MLCKCGFDEIERFEMISIGVIVDISREVSTWFGAFREWLSIKVCQEIFVKISPHWKSCRNRCSRAEERYSAVGGSLKIVCEIVEPFC